MRRPSRAAISAGSEARAPVADIVTGGSEDDTVRIRRIVGEPPPPPRGRRGLALGAVGLLVAAAAGGALYALLDDAPPPQRLGPRRLVPPLLRTVLRGQSVCFVLARRSEQDADDPPGTPAPRERIELLALNADDLSPRFTVDLASVPLGGLADAELIAEQGATVWLWLGGIGAVSAVDGQILADTAGILDLNPELGEAFAAMPRRAFRLADGLVYEVGGRAWRIDPRDFKASPANLPAPRPLPQLNPAAAFGAGGPTAFRVAEARLGTDWLALPSDAAKLAGPLPVQGEGRFLPPAAMPAGGGQLLWRGTIRMGSAAPPGWPATMPGRWGQAEQVADPSLVPGLAPLPLAGFMTTGTTAPIIMAGPPGLLLLSGGGTDGLGLARIGAEGAVAWRVTLPIHRLRSVLPGAGSVLLAGLAAGDAQDMLVAVALADGAVVARAISA
jgi:hypothetical protein